MERLVLLLQQQEKSAAETDTVDLYIAGIGEQGSQVGFGLAHEIRAEKFSVAMDHEGRSLKSQMKQAHKAGARFVLIIGDAELESGKGILRNMGTEEEQQDILLSAQSIAECLLKK
jgi:histidyl-tRNA synthetase